MTVIIRDIVDAQSFVMVWRGGSGGMTKQHTTMPLAVQEAKRLANDNDQATFYVLVPVKMVRRIDLDTPITLRELENLPADVISQLSKKLQRAIEYAKEALPKPLIGIDDNDFEETDWDADTMNGVG